MPAFGMLPDCSASMTRRSWLPSGDAIIRNNGQTSMLAFDVAESARNVRGMPNGFNRFCRWRGLLLAVLSQSEARN